MHDRNAMPLAAHLVLLLSFWNLWLQPAEAAAAEVQVFDNVNVISMSPDQKRRVQKRQRVVVRDGEILAIGRARRVAVPEGATIIDGNRGYLLPGLVDMHAHGEDIEVIPEGFSEEELFRFYLANGVTAVYDPWGFDSVFRWRRDVERGRILGPRLYFSSPGVNDGNHSSADEVEESVRRWARRGYQAIKTHSPITRDKFERLHAVARELGLPVIGHALRPGFPLQDTLDEGQRMLAHVEEILSTTVPFNQPQSHASDLEGPLAAIVAAGTWVTTTVGTYDIIVKTVADDTFDALFERPEMRYLPPSVHQIWRQQNLYRRPDFLQDPAFWARLLEVKKYIVKELESRGALDRLLFGTDSGIPLLIPGFGIHDELRVLVDSGLTPWQALSTATYNPAVFLDEVDRFGSVEVGKRADLLLVAQNPLKKIANLEKVSGVMVAGRWLTRAELDANLERLAERWQG